MCDVSGDDILCIKISQPTSQRGTEYQGVGRTAVSNRVVSMVRKGLSEQVTFEGDLDKSRSERCGNLGGAYSRRQEVWVPRPSGGGRTQAAVQLEQSEPGGE